jgi:hypothetical protein
VIPGPAGLAPQDPVAVPEPSFRDRGRLRRRLRHLRRVRELGFRDLGGLVFDLHRFGRRGDELVAEKLNALGAVDLELRALERALADERPFHELREPGLAACPRCAAIHGSDARFCPSCGTSLRGSLAVGELAEAPREQPPVMPPSPAPSVTAHAGSTPVAGTLAAEAEVTQALPTVPVVADAPPEPVVGAQTVVDTEPDPVAEATPEPEAAPEPQPEPVVEPESVAPPHDPADADGTPSPDDVTVVDLRGDSEA